MPSSPGKTSHRGSSTESHRPELARCPNQSIQRPSSGNGHYHPHRNDTNEDFFSACILGMERQTNSPRFSFAFDHVGHAQATTAGHTYEKNQSSSDFLSLL